MSSQRKRKNVEIQSNDIEREWNITSAFRAFRGALGIERAS